MDPITALAIKAGASWLGPKFKTLVIDRWARRRAEAFFATFLEELAATDDTGQPLSNMEPMLAEMLIDDIKSQVLFDAYRRVSLSASPSLGPRIIAVLKARLIRQGRAAKPEEERLMMVAETFSDDELLALCTYLGEHTLENYQVKISDDTVDLNWRRETAIGPVNIGEWVGNWCLKLQNTGLVVQDILMDTRDYEVDSERHIDGSGTLTTYVWMLIFQPEVLELKSMIESLRAVPMEAGA